LQRAATASNRSTIFTGKRFRRRCRLRRMFYDWTAENQLRHAVLL
jgi:hypothetical protein